MAPKPCAEGIARFAPLSLSKSKINMRVELRFDKLSERGSEALRGGNRAVRALSLSKGQINIRLEALCA